MPPQLINVSRPRNAPDFKEPTVMSKKKIAVGKRKTKHVRCSNTLSVVSSKRKLGSDNRIFPPSNFAWNKRWNYRMFRTSMLFPSVRPQIVASKSLKLQQCNKMKSSKKVTSLPTPPVKKAEVKKKSKLRLPIFRRRFRSGFDYMRKKKKNQQPGVLKRPRVCLFIFCLFV